MPSVLDLWHLFGWSNYDSRYFCWILSLTREWFNDTVIKSPLWRHELHQISVLTKYLPLWTQKYLPLRINIPGHQNSHQLATYFLNPLLPIQVNIDQVIHPNSPSVSRCAAHHRTQANCKQVYFPLLVSIQETHYTSVTMCIVHNDHTYSGDYCQ